MAKLQDMHRHPTNPPLAYFITVRTYGTWLHGDDRGSVDRSHNTYNTPLVEPNPNKVRSEQNRQNQPPILLTPEAATTVESTIREVCTHRHWTLHEVAARTNHFHAIISAPHTAERIMNDLKSWTTRRLREAAHIPPDQHPWAQHGSTPHLYTDTELAAAIDYVRNRQGPPLGSQENP